MSHSNRFNLKSAGPRKSRKSFEEGVEDQARDLMIGKLTLEQLKEDSTLVVVAAVQKRANELSNQASTVENFAEGVDAAKQLKIKTAQLIKLLNDEQSDSIIGIAGVHEQNPQMEALLDELIKSTDEKRELFFEMCLDGYGKMMEVLSEVGGDIEKVPSWEKILLALTPEVLLKALSMNKPTLLITPNNCVEDKISAMNRNKKFASNIGQCDVFLWRAEDVPFESFGTPIKNIISIVDGQPHMPHIEGISSNSMWGERRVAFRDYFAKRGMKLINVHEALVLEQLSLQAFKTNNYDKSRIVDYSNYPDPEETLSCLNEEYLRDSVSVAYSSFRMLFREVYFSESVPGFTRASLRGRPSVPFLEY